jgi:L-amino acid N-acyltransferase YncA
MALQSEILKNKNTESIQSLTDNSGFSMNSDNQHREEEVFIREVRDHDRDRIIAIFNYYAATSFAAYPEIPVNDGFFAFLHEGVLGFYVLEHEAQVVGFGLMKPLLPFPAFMTTGILTYFIQPEYTRMSLGKKLLDCLTNDAKKMGMTSLVANMASKNKASIRFHLRYGFTEVGRLHNAGSKSGEPFDMIWMQMML